MDLEKMALESVDRQAARLAELGKDIWAHPEVDLEEVYSAELLCQELEKHGFKVNRGVAGMPTAFTAEWGRGNPAIGFIGEYDANPGISQKVQLTKEPVVAGGPGHGCGHNLEGVAALGAAVAARDALERAGLPGTIRYFGTPAEETLAGKPFMAREGVFDGLDICFKYHPMDLNSTPRISMLAMNNFKVHFHGVSSHAAAAPHMGKSALDGAVLMYTGVEYLREHVEQEVRMQCVISNGGGAPNIVPPEATIWYYVRAPRRETVDRVYARMVEIAKAAAQMTATTCDIEVLAACHEMLVNHTIDDVIQEKMVKLGGPGFTAEVQAFATELQKSQDPQITELNIRQRLQQYPGITRADLADAAQNNVLPPPLSGVGAYGSEDAGDVSKIVPMGWFTTCTWPVAFMVHTWQNVVATGSDMGARGMLFAARAMAAAAAEFLTKPELVQAARDEFERNTAGKAYVSPLPPEAYPHR